MSVPLKPFQASLMTVGKAGVYPFEEPFRCSTLGLPAKNRLGWKGLQVTNTLAYYIDKRIIQ
jgi:hypothetical protein